MPPSALAHFDAIFIDDGGVMSDNSLRAVQWGPLVGEFLAPRFGGAPEAWAAANRNLFSRLMSGEIGHARTEDFDSHTRWHAAYAAAWLTAMCDAVGVARPPAERARPWLIETDDYVARRLNAPMPGAAAAVRRLHSTGIRLHTGSGGDTRQLANYTETLGIRDCFHTLYGADLVDTTKDRPEFYARILQHAGIAPASALFIDESATALRWVASVGASTAHISTEPDAQFDYSAPSLEALVAQLLAE